VSGVAVYFLARVVKGYVQRGRPGALLAAVNEREMFAHGSLGFPSGHAAVSAAITIVVLAFLGMPWRIAAAALAVAVPLCRMYVGAHLPLDLIGGAAMGVAIASVMVVILGRQPRHPQGQRAPPQTR
jgi:undecaprenyl-diphosphatase